MYIHVGIAWIVSTAISILFVILYPLVLAILANKRLAVSWRYFGYGILVFLVFQLLTRVPLVTWLGIVLAPQLKASKTLLFTWIIALAFTAGLFEEVGRYVGYRLFMRREEKTWSKAVMYGIGHGGLESMLLIGGLGLLTLLNVILLSNIDLNTLPASQHATVVRQLTAINIQPAWFPLLSLWERLWTMPIQIGLSVIVLQVFRRKNILWLGVAILAHTVVDSTAVVFPQVFGSSVNASLVLEGVIALFGIIAIWTIWRLRDRPIQSVQITEIMGHVSTQVK